ncbi:MAG: thioredoxin domain-containing protein, partial [Planctomycetota bacterium]
GGFGSAPKFPIPHTLLFLLSYWYRTKKETALEMVKKTLTAMRLGGIYDQIGFGFHRYSTDEKWHIPHFEKMIYDQAMISIAYSQTYAITKNEFYKKVAEEILTYVARDMTSPDGAFYTAEDADSEGQEGKFYMWKVEEIKNALGENDAKLFLEIFNLTAIDNLNPHNLFENNERYVLYLKHPVPIDLTEKVNSLREKLFDIRAKRIRPFKDDKILTDWNGLMIASLSIASRVFNRPDYAIKAKNAADFILEKMDNKNGGLFHSYRENMSKVNGFLNDYAFFCWGLLELYEATFDIKYLKKAISFTDYQLEHFRDERNGTMFITTKENTEHIMKTPEVYDGAIPSGNSVSLHNLLRLYHLTGNNKYNQYAHELINAFSSEIKKYGPGYTHFLSGVDFALNSSYQIVIVGKRNTENMKLLLSALNSQFLPNKVVLLKDDDITDTIEQIAPYTKYHKPIANKATAYVCKNFVCHLPTTDAKEMLTLFKN